MALPTFTPQLSDRSRVHSQQLRRTAFGLSVPPDNSRSTLVVSHHLGGLLRATAAGLLHPAASHGVRRVSRCRRPSHSRVLRPVSPFPATRFIPFKGFPSSIAVPHHCGLFLLVVGRQPPRPHLGSDRSRDRLPPRTEVRWRSLRRTDRSRVASCRLRRDVSKIRTEPRPKPPLELTLLRRDGLPSTRSGRNRGKYLTVTPKCAGGTKARAPAR